MPIFDTHAHYDDDAFSEDRDRVLTSLAEHGVGYVINPGCDLASSQTAIDLAAAYPFLYAAVGLHPENCHSASDRDFQIIESMTLADKVVAVGEIGLDYHFQENPPREKQQDVFRRQCDIARKQNLPVVIHDRDAHEDCLSVIREFPGLFGVFHCFSGSVEMAELLLRDGWYLGFDGPLTYQNARKAVKVAAMVPLDRILIETDSPYLPPVPLRGTRNDSRNLSYVAEKLAEIKQLSSAEIVRITEENGKRLFRL